MHPAVVVNVEAVLRVFAVSFQMSILHMPVQTIPILIVGAGPVGLLLANLLCASRCHEFMIIDKRQSQPDWSRAIGLTPPSLSILETVGLHSTFIDQGVKVRVAHVHGDDTEIGRLDFGLLRREKQFPFILSIPQVRTMQILSTNLSQQSGCVMGVGVELIDLSPGDDGVRCTLMDHSTGRLQTVHAAVVFGCDGCRSTVRRLAGIGYRRKEYGSRFVMADFESSPELGEEAHLFFTRRGSVESFPLPGGHRRWIALAAESPQTCATDLLCGRVHRIAGYRLNPEAAVNPTFFTPEHLLAERYFSGRLVLCGDAAHVMTPIGGQGMNTGFSDAEFLAAIATQIVDGSSQAGVLLRAYERCRRKAFRVASRRAALGMWVGTRTGRVASLLRGLAFRVLLLDLPVRCYLAPLFAMLNVPYNRFGRTSLPMNGTG